LAQEVERAGVEENTLALLNQAMGLQQFPYRGRVFRERPKARRTVAIAPEGFSNG
jgi:hypothetical protein